MYIEHQPNGHFLGGAWGYGKARDWARFGLLHLRGGVWIDGTRILPEGWTERSQVPTPTNEYGRYSFHTWMDPRIGRKMYYASGFRNQNVYVFPQDDLVVVRFAMPRPAAHPLYRQVPFLEGVLGCLGFNATASA